MWLDRVMIEAIHASQISEHGGSHGLREPGLLESALARPRNRWLHGGEGVSPDVAELGAALAFGLIRDHPFVAGSKRVGLMAAYTFLILNALELDAPEPEAVLVIRDVAAGELGEPELIAWLRDRSRAAEADPR